MSNYQRKNTGGAMFPEQNKKSAQAPDFTGEVEFLRDEVLHLVEALKAGNKAKLRIAGWKQTSKKDKPFMGLKLTVPQAPKQNPFDDQSSGQNDPWGDGSNDLDDTIPF